MKTESIPNEPCLPSLAHDMLWPESGARCDPNERPLLSRSHTAWHYFHPLDHLTSRVHSPYCPPGRVSIRSPRVVRIKLLMPEAAGIGCYFSSGTPGYHRLWKSTRSNSRPSTLRWICCTTSKISLPVVKESNPLLFSTCLKSCGHLIGQCSNNST